MEPGVFNIDIATCVASSLELTGVGTVDCVGAGDVEAAVVVLAVVAAVVAAGACGRALDLDLEDLELVLDEVDDLVMVLGVKV